MYRGALSLAVLLGLGLTRVAPAAADVLVIEPGRRITCVITAEKDARYYFISADGRGVVLKQAVMRLQRASASENAALRAQWTSPALPPSSRRTTTAAAHPQRPAPVSAPASAPANRSAGRRVGIDTIGDMNFRRVVLDSDTPVLVDFYAVWCGPCHRQSPIVAKLARDYVGQIAFAKVDVDRSPKTADRFRVRSLPTLILFEDGKPVKRFVGLHTADDLRPTLDLAAR